MKQRMAVRVALATVILTIASTASYSMTLQKPADKSDRFTIKILNGYNPCSSGALAAGNPTVDTSCAVQQMNEKNAQTKEQMAAYCKGNPSDPQCAGFDPKSTRPNTIKNVKIKLGKKYQEPGQAEGTSSNQATSKGYGYDKNAAVTGGDGSSKKNFQEKASTASTRH